MFSNSKKSEIDPRGGGGQHFSNNENKILDALTLPARGWGSKEYLGFRRHGPCGLFSVWHILFIYFIVILFALSGYLLKEDP